MFEALQNFFQGDLLQLVIYYAELAVAMAIWIGIACLLVAGLERVFFKIFTRRPPLDAVVQPAVEEPTPHA